MYARPHPETSPARQADSPRRDASAAAGPRAPAAAAAPAEEGGSRVLIGLFIALVCLSVPFSVGTTQLYTARVFILIAFIPLVFAWISGKAGRITWADGFFALHAVWIFLALMLNNGMGQFKFAMVSIVEIFGAYLLGRLVVRGPGTYRAFIRYHLIAMIVLLPFILMEMANGNAVVQDIFKAVFQKNYPDINHSPRAGFWRAQGPFTHPILWGVFCSIAVANGYYLMRPSRFKGIVRAGFGLFMTFASLSSGPFLSGLSQVGLIVWGEVTRGKWWLLAGIAAAMYVFLSFASNRGPIVLMIETATFSSGTGWTRIIQYIHGIDDVKANPIFGIGMNDWSRPGWLGGSVDNFWLLTAMRYGAVGFAFLMLGLAFNFAGVVRAVLGTEEERNCRLAYLVGSVSLFLTLATVHIWSQVALFVMFYYGAGAWMYTRPAAETLPEAAPEGAGEAPDAAPSETGERPRRGGPTRTYPVRRRPVAPGPARAARQGRKPLGHL
jgi:hypothetical protein